jgi:hypothetical protein
VIIEPFEMIVLQQSVILILGVTKQKKQQRESEGEREARAFVNDAIIQTVFKGLQRFFEAAQKSAEEIFFMSM